MENFLFFTQRATYSIQSEFDFTFNLIDRGCIRVPPDSIEEKNRQ